LVVAANTVASVTKPSALSTVSALATTALLEDVSNNLLVVHAQPTCNASHLCTAIASTAPATLLLKTTSLAVNSKLTGHPFLALLASPA
jgi:hypothetical protein